MSIVPVDDDAWSWCGERESIDWLGQILVGCESQPDFNLEEQRNYQEGFKCEYSTVFLLKQNFVLLLTDWKVREVERPIDKMSVIDFFSCLFHQW